MLLREGLPLVENTLECTIPRKLIGGALPSVWKWYRTVIDELQRISEEVWLSEAIHHMMQNAEITPEAELKQHFFCKPAHSRVRSCD